MRRVKVCFFVNRITLVKQASRAFDMAGIDHAIIQGDNPRHNLDKPVQIASIQTYHKRPFRWDFDLAIEDECHEVYKKQTEFKQSWKLVPFIGITATPYTKGLGNIYDHLINEITINDLIEQGYLVECEVYGPSQPDMKGVTGGADFNQKQTAERCQESGLVASIIQTWHKLADNKQTICFATNILHSKYIVDEFVKSGVNAKHIDAYSDTQERYEIIEGFKEGYIKLISSVGVLTTGFDAPNAEVGIMARPTKSLMLSVQMIGRLLRIHPGKDKALILDHAGNFERLGFHTDPMPQELCKLQKGDKKKTKEIVLPKPCPKCKFMRPVKVNICPNCAFEAKSQNEIFEEAGELRKIKAKKATNREYSASEKQSFYSGLLAFANNKNYSSGWASHKYRDKFGVWPSFMNKVKGEITQEVSNYITHGNIAYAKRSNKNV